MSLVSWALKKLSWKLEGPEKWKRENSKRDFFYYSLERNADVTRLSGTRRELRWTSQGQGVLWRNGTKEQRKSVMEPCPPYPFTFNLGQAGERLAHTPSWRASSALPSHSLTATHTTSAVSHNTPASLELIEHWSQQTLVNCLEREKRNLPLHTTWTETPFRATFKFCRPCVSIRTYYISWAHTLFKPDHTSIGIISIPPQILGHYILNI